MLRISISDQFSGASMSRASRQQRTMTGRLLGLEWLEPRRLLSLWAGIVDPKRWTTQATCIC